MNPQFPLYIPSKGRWEPKLSLTHNVLQSMNVPHRLVIEEQEYKNYSDEMDKKHLLVLDKKYQRDYDIFEDIGVKGQTGPGPARNFIWDHSMSEGHAWHWVMDDNIDLFMRLNRNIRVGVSDGTIFKCMEDFCLRYKNVAMGGPNFVGIGVARKEQHPPFVMNTRVVCCVLIRNDTGFRWRGRYSEDMDLSVRMLKAGWCTILFNAFLQRKATTMTMKGGCTDTLYVDGQADKKSTMLLHMHPDVTRLVWKKNHWHHVVNWTPFRQNKLIRVDGLQTKSGVDNYGMQLQRKTAATKKPASKKLAG